MGQNFQNQNQIIGILDTEPLFSGLNWIELELVSNNRFGTGFVRFSDVWDQTERN